MSETTNLKLFKHDNPATNENQFDVTKALNNNWDKIDTFAGTTNTKITENQNNIKSLQTDNTTNKKDIATLKSDNTTNKANIKALQDDNKTNKDNIEELQQENEELKAENERLRQDMNAYPSNTAEGEYITLNDSADSRFNKFTIKGNSVQKITTQSANVWSDNTTRTFDNSHRVQSVNLKPNIKAGTYKFSCDISNLILGTNTGLHLASEIVYEDDSTDVSFYLIPFNAIREDTRYSNSITIEKNIKSISLKVGATQTTNGGSMTVSNFCLRADDSDEYVEFVPDSPNPNFKSDIRNVGDNINLVGGTLIKGYYEGSGSYINNALYRCFKVNLKAGTYTYSYSANLTFIRQVDITHNIKLSVSNTTFTINEDAEISLAFRKTDSTEWDLGETLEDIKFKLEKGMTASSYSKKNFGNIGIIICNNNLTNTDIIASLENSAITINSKNSFSIDLSKGYVTPLQNKDLFLGKNDKNKRYKLSYHLYQNNSSFRPYLVFRYSDGTATTSPNNGSQTEMDVTLNSTEGKTIESICFGWGTQNDGGVATLSDIYLRQVDDTSEFQEQEKQEFVFPLAEGQILREGDYLAEDGIHHLRKQFVVDGTEKIYNASLITDKDTVSFNLNKPGAVGPYYGESPIRFCNIYGEDYIKDWGYFSDNPGSLGVGSTTNQLRFVIDNSFIGLVDNSDQEANQEKVANWLKDNNIVVEEEVDEYVEAYTSEQQAVYDELVKTAKTYKTVTNIFSTNEVSPKFEVEYRQDIKSLINNVSQAVLNNA